MTAGKRTNQRTIKTVSFAANEYERGLLEHATDPSRGTFSQYVKRLIERDREGLTVAVVQPTTAPVKANVISEEDRNAALGYL